ncbi:MAG TPA: metalloregulator ArsR/SmtB family transcription factor [Terriglobia bacterium]|jgi:DNA-binding transcriptional ArsR family regulator|nr:metalloregulator ArsR/SmtB family transcription factor [Terriglobia bacterium]HVJ70247.1 metalloregulator ArsR/SmtB family transcription factor [Sphingomicrobium sp.]
MDVFVALAHPVRRKVLAMLRKGPLCSGDIATEFDVAWPTMTGHLKTLKDAGLVTAERQGTSIVYRLNASILEETAAALLDLGSAIKGKQKP